MKKKQRVPMIQPQKNSGDSQWKAIDTDPQGSYTGRPENPYEIPVQDADDL